MWSEQQKKPGLAPGRGSYLRGVHGGSHRINAAGAESDSVFLGKVGGAKCFIVGFIGGVFTDGGRNTSKMEDSN